MLNLRDYQQALADKILAAWQHYGRVLAVLATGGGKTVIFCWLMRGHIGASAAVVHRKEIVSQISCSLAAMGVKHRLVAQPKTVQKVRRRHLKKFNQSFIDPNALVGVVSVQTLTSRSSERNAPLQRWLKQVTLAVFDEGHHYYQSGLWARAVELLDGGKQLFVTATPTRADGKGLGADADGFADVMVEGPQTQWLIDEGYLAPFVYKAPATDLNVADIPLTAKGDINTKVMRSRITHSHLVGNVVEHYFKYARGLRTIVFANDIATAREHEQAFVAAGVRAVTLTGDTDQGVRDRELDGFEDGTGAQVLINVDLFDEGFDVAGVQAVILARITDSLGKFLQMIGRCLRVIYARGFDLSTTDGRKAAIAASEKPQAIIIDAVRNWERGHGMPDWHRRWSLAGRSAARRGEDGGVTLKVCTACTQPYEAFRPACPYCGAVPVPLARSTPDQVDGDLFELDVDAMRALFEQISAAGMTDEEFELDMIARNTPMIGRGVQRRHHKAGNYRRGVLLNLIGWWVGMQPGRDLHEVHRRFYHRFGIDIGMAQTLNAAETDKLIETIGRRFGEDMAA